MIHIFFIIFIYIKGSVGQANTKGNISWADANIYLLGIHFPQFHFPGLSSSWHFAVSFSPNFHSCFPLSLFFIPNSHKRLVPPQITSTNRFSKNCDFASRTTHINLVLDTSSARLRSSSTYVRYELGHW